MRTLLVRRLEASEWRMYRGLRLSALADSPDAFGSTLNEEKELSDDWWSARLGAGTASTTDLPLVVELEGEGIGLSWGRIEASNPAAAYLYQMWVAPSFRRLGAGQLLLAATIDWARSSGARALKLGVTCGNTPAMQLYARAGFEDEGPAKPLRPGSPIFAQPMSLEL